MENEYEVVEFDTNECIQSDFDVFSEKLDRICPNIDVEAKIKNMMGWE